MTLLDYASLINASGPIVLVSIILLAVRRYPDPFFRSWFASYCFAVLLALGEFVATLLGHPLGIAVFESLMGGAVAWWLWRAAFEVQGLKTWRHGYVLLLSAIAGIDLWAWFGHRGYMTVTVFPLLAVVSALIGLGSGIFKNAGTSLPRSARWVGPVIASKGLWIFTYPILEPTPLAWIGYWIDGMIDVVMGLGMLVLLLERASSQAQLQAEQLRIADKERIEHLERMERVKSDFVSATSHELRTPLTSIRGYAEFLEDEIAGPLGPDQKAFVRRIQHGAERLGRLVDDLLDFVRLEAGTFVLDIQPADLIGIVREEVAAFAPQMADKGLDISLDLPFELPPVPVDSKRIGQVLSNLIANAVKFTPPGGQLRVGIEGLSERVRLIVRDTGIGIPMAAQGRVFEKFYQVPPGIRRQYGGTGLGLSISRALVEAHGGTIGVESGEGRGSTFWFELPRPEMTDG